MFGQTHFSPVAYAMLVVLCVLGVASITQWALARYRPLTDWTELRLRIRTWWLIVGGFAGALWAGTPIAMTALGLVAFVALKEYLSVVPTRRADHQVLFWAYAAIPLQFYWASIHWYGMFVLFIPVYLFLWLALRTVLTGETRNFIYAVGVLHWGLMTTVFMLSHLAYLLVLPADNPTRGYSGAGLLLFVALVTEANDVCQYIWGKLLGRHKVVPKVSPKKTWEGLMGGMLSTTLIVWALGPYLTPLAGWQLYALGPLLSLAGFSGDIVLSGVKRDLGIKDYGAALPGHGGVLDRLDSLIFTAPLFFHFIRYFYY